MEKAKLDYQSEDLLVQVLDRMAEHDQVFQFFQAALTGTGDLSPDEKQGLFKLLEYQRQDLAQVRDLIRAAGGPRWVDSTQAS